MGTKNTIKKMIEEMLEAWIIRNTRSPYASPFVMVKKTDGPWSMCVDYRVLNQKQSRTNIPFNY